MKLVELFKENNFDKNLAESQNKEIIFDKFYEAVFPNLSRIEKTDIENDKRGIDKIITLMSGEKLKIQEKFREVDYGDFLIECFHKFENGSQKIGWLYSMVTNFIVYKVPKKIYIIDCNELRTWINKNWKFFDNLPYKKAWNPRGKYWTYNRAIPWEKLEFVKFYEFE